MQSTREGKLSMFLLTVGLILIGSVLLIGWGSTYWPFKQREPAFLGALVGASGTIFAACVAYTAASQNLEIGHLAAETAAKQKIEGEAIQRRFAKEQAIRELQQMRDLFDFSNRILERFAGASEAGSRDYFIYMTEAIRDGFIAFYQGGAPEPFGNKARETYQRFYNVRSSVEQSKNRLVGIAQDYPERADLNRAIRDRLGEITALRGQVDEDIRRRERALDAMLG
jgi:hypothetical protein